MKEKVLKGLNNNKLYICAFIVGIVIIGILYKLNNVTPLGSNSLLCIDFYHQYGPMLGELYDRLHGSGGFIYSFNMALGLPFFRNFLNYLSSPFNIIMLLFPRKWLVTSYSFIIGLKAVVSCFTMVYFLSKKFNNKELYLLPLGIIYAFSAFFTAYYWNIMWLDGMVFLPIITLGIENIVNNNKWKMYTIFLSIMLVANYFIGYMICIYSVVYFILYLLYKTKFRLKKKEIIPEIKKFIKKGLIFGIASLAAGALGAGLLLPMAKSMASISATGGTMPTSQYYDFEPVDYLKSHFTGTKITTFASDDITSPNISCGILSIALLLLYVLNLEIPIKNKICYSLALGFIIFAFFNPQLDYILHAFHVPNDLPYRYSFLYSFLLVEIGAYALINIKKMKFPMIALSYVFLMVLLLSISKDNWSGITTNMIYINMIILTLYFIFYAAIYFLDELHIVFYLALTIVACIDVIVSINFNWNITQVLETFYQDYEATEQLLDYVENYDNDLFYRIENTSSMTLNDSSWYGYHGMTTFSSMAYEDMAILQYNLGMPGNEINSYQYIQSTPIYDLMFNIKYFIGVANDTNRYTELTTIEETVNEFDYNVGLVYGVNKDIKDWNYISRNPFLVQNDYMYKATGIESILEPSALIKTEEVYTDNEVTILKLQYENKYDNMYYYARSNNIKFMIVGGCLYYNDSNYQTYIDYTDELEYNYIENYNEKKIININSSEEYVTFYVAYSTYYQDSYEVYTINQGKFNGAYEYLNNHKMDMTSFKENKIEGNITLDDDMIIYTSIPYDEGWHVYIDGKEVNTYKLADTLLAVDCPSGTHKVVFKYKAPLMGIGFIISTITLALIIIDHFFKDKIIKKIKEILPKKKALSK